MRTLLCTALLLMAACTDPNANQALGTLDQERLNIDGGAIAIGHPVGASGARIILHALKVLERTGGRRAIAT